MYFKKLLIVLIGIATISCGGNSNKEKIENESDSTNIAQEEMSAEMGAVSIWDRVSVRATPAENGKWLTSLSLGEKLTYLGKEENDDQGKTYLNIRLNDGTEGWSRTEFVIPEAEPAVFVNESDVYNRPDLLTKSDDKFSKMDIVAIKQLQDDWAEVTGKPTGEKWLTTGWVKTNNLTTEDVDIAMAKFAKPVIDSDNNDKIEKLEEILENQDLTASMFTPDIKEALDEIKLKQQTDATEIETDTTAVEN